MAFAFGASSAVQPAFGAQATQQQGALFGPQRQQQSSVFGSQQQPQQSGTMFGGQQQSAFGSAAPLPQSVLSGVQLQTASSVAHGLQSVIEDTTRLALVVSGPELYGDERDAVVSKLNQFLAAVGTGKGYYHSSQLSTAQPATTFGQMQLPPYEFKIDNVFHRLKGVVYNRLSQHRNADGMVSLVLAVHASQVESSQQRQRVRLVAAGLIQPHFSRKLKVIDAVNALLRKPQSAPTLSISAPAQKQTITVHADLKSVIPLGDNLTEIVIAVREYGRGIWPATQLYYELRRSEESLKQNLNCVGIVPRIEVSKDDLNNYLSQAPPGFEVFWPQAIKANPEPDKLVPFPIQGFKQLLQRQRMQKSSMDIQSAMLAELTNRLEKIQLDVFNVRNSYTRLKDSQRTLSHRLLRALSMQTLLQRYGSIVDAREEGLQCRLESLAAQLSGPGRLKSRLEAVMELMARDGENIEQEAKELAANRLSNIDVGEVKRCLSSRQTQLENLVGTTNRIVEIVDTIEKDQNR